VGSFALDDRSARLRNRPDEARPAPLLKSHPLFVPPALLGRRERDVLEDMRRRSLRRHKRQLQMIDNPVHGGIVRDEGHDLHRRIAVGELNDIPLKSGLRGEKWLGQGIPSSMRSAS